VLGYSAGALAQLGYQLETAASWSEKALAMRPGLASTLFWAGWIDVLMGHLERGEERLRHAQQLNPHSTARAHSSTGIGLSLLLQNRPDEAIGPLRNATQHAPHLLIAQLILCAALGQTGRIDEARTLVHNLPPVEQLKMLFRPLMREEHRAILERAIAISNDSGNVVHLAKR
jgi:tetratricopeptide (TPR) repeat protein